MTLDNLNELAESTPDSKNTTPGEILFFRQNSSIGESLKKLKNHNFKIGYSFAIDVYGKDFTRIIAYNQKNDIFSGWAGFVEQDGEMKEVFPIVGNGFSCYLNMPRIDDTGKLKLFRENMGVFNRQTGYAKRMFEGLSNLDEIDDLSLFGIFWPILENPEVERFRRNQQAVDKEIYCDAALLCNIYKFDETYLLLDDGLKRIYKLLFEKREEMFCTEYSNYYDNSSVISKALDYLDLTEEEIKDIFVRNNMQYPSRTEYQNEWNISLFKSIKNNVLLSKKSKKYKF